MHIVIYTKTNGFGLSRDAEVLERVIKALGYQVSIREPHQPMDADISFHCEIPSLIGIKRSSMSFFYPNWEWFIADDGVVRRFTAVLCKTQHAVDHAYQYTDRVIYTGFTSEDMYTTATKNIEFQHIAGQSPLKNTLAVAECWADHPDLPTLHLYHSRNMLFGGKSPKNVRYHFGHVGRNVIKRIMNENLFALYPSATEGYGHALWESLSTGAILLTTDAPPMDSIAPAFKIPVAGSGTYNRDTIWQVSPEDIYTTAITVLNLSPGDLTAYSLASRRYWVEGHNDFIGNIGAIISTWQ